MSRVILKTVQDKRNLKRILNGTYKPKFSLSYGMFDEGCMESYRYMLDKLAEKTSVEYSFGEDTCIWSWYQNPYFRNHVNFKNIGVELVVITFEVDEEDVVFSDFDLWCDRLFEDKDIDCVVRVGEIGVDRCVQAVTWSIPKDSVLYVEPFSEYIKKDLNINGGHLV